MDRHAVSRRNALKLGGGFVGALGAMTLLAPPARTQPWVWSPSGSVAGAGVGADPRTVWDAEADPVIANVIERGNVPKINAALRDWIRND
ncbi:hypothetical protein GCM10009624_18560 [Gordonia sinesedis]